MEPESRQELVAQGKSLKERLATLDIELDAMESLLQVEGQKLPNLTHPDVSLHAPTKLSCGRALAV